MSVYRSAYLGPVTLSVEWRTDSIGVGVDAWCRWRDREGAVRVGLLMLHLAAHVDWSGVR